MPPRNAQNGGNLRQQLEVVDSTKQTPFFPDMSLNISRQSENPQQQGVVFPTDEQWQNLIDWVNSFSDSHCLLVSTYRDLLDGIALCHLVSMIVCSPED